MLINALNAKSQEPAVIRRFHMLICSVSGNPSQ